VHRFVPTAMVSKSMTGHHNIVEPKKTPTSWLGSIQFAQADHHLRLTLKPRDHLATWADSNSHVVAGDLRESVVLCAAQW
jgi:hypothetical protein